MLQIYIFNTHQDMKEKMQDIRICNIVVILVDISTAQQDFQTIPHQGETFVLTTPTVFRMNHIRKSSIFYW